MFRSCNSEIYALLLKSNRYIALWLVYASILMISVLYAICFIYNFEIVFMYSKKLLLYCRNYFACIKL